LLREALAWFECEFINEHSTGDHVLVLGKVIGGKLLDSKAEPMSTRNWLNGWRLYVISRRVR
jgi:flavin reductase (DIM6/NTAB) family NADH-FMN oxidoreductase RutF